MSKIIDIRWDEQDPQNKGWAYWVEGGESGPIDGDAADAIDRIADNIEAKTGDYDAIIAASGTHADGALVATCWLRATQRIPLATWWVAADADAAAGIWPLIGTHMAKARAWGLRPPPLADSPPAAPWVAATIEAGATLGPDAPEDMMIIGDLERCMAWAWIDYRRAHARRP